MNTALAPQTPVNPLHIAARIRRIKPSPSTSAADRANELRRQGKSIVNLVVGEPDFDTPANIRKAAAEAMDRGETRYTLMAGTVKLREAIAAKLRAWHEPHGGRDYHAATEITVTAGATQAILTAILAVVHPGDEVIVLEPCYDSYVPNIELAGGTAVRVPLVPGSFRPDFDRISAAITPRTRAILINSPHNPSATVWSAADMHALQDILAPTDIVLISDEVYEHMVFDGLPHQSAARFPGLAARAFIVSSFGKTYHVTGWKVGYVAAPASLSAEFRKVHQFNVFTVNTPVQYGLAAYMADPKPYLELPAFYQRKRDLFRKGLERTRFEVLPSEGSYFQCVGISQVTRLDEAGFCRWLTNEMGVAAIPLSAFYAEGFDQRVVRFCFAKREDTLNQALDRLARL